MNINKTYNVLNNLLKFIGKNDAIGENEKVNVLVKTFFTKDDNKEIPNINKLNIAKITVTESDDETIGILIVLGEPGLLVGKDGKTIKQLGGFISKLLDKRARIYVEECNIFENENMFFI